MPPQAIRTRSDRYVTGSRPMVNPSEKPDFVSDGKRLQSVFSHFSEFIFFDAF